ncbi:MAG: O-antigen ligase family protein [Clostridium perfringens]|nr:O-antigen ligase family protein [Clostridium perfringens]MDU6175738.1 O-antigen ligase family protein [Clostridium perfringens]
MKNKKYDNLIYYIFILIPIVDSINGILIKNNVIFNIGQIYRILTMVIMVFIAMKISKNYFNIFVIAILFFLSLNLYYYYYNNNIKSILEDIISNSKLFMIFVIYFSYKVMLNNNKIGNYVINKIISTLIIIFPLTILIPYILGIGFNTYSNSAGFKGFYNANNDLSIVLLIFTIFAINDFLNKRSLKSTIILSINIISLLMVGAKTSLLGLALVLIIYFKNILLKLFKRKGIFITIILSTIIYIFYDDLIAIWNKSIERLNYFYNINNSFITLLLSHRNIYLIDSFKVLINIKYPILALLLGTGTYFRCNGVVQGRIVEMDFFDILFSNGLIVLIIVIYLLYYIYRDRYKGNSEYDYKLAFIITIVLSVIVGHVFYSAMSGTILSIIMMGLVTKQYKVD